MTVLTITEGRKFALRRQHRTPVVRWYVSDADGRTLGAYSTREEAERAAASSSTPPRGEAGVGLREAALVLERAQ